MFGPEWSSQVTQFCFACFFCAECSTLQDIPVNASSEEGVRKIKHISQNAIENQYANICFEYGIGHSCTWEQNYIIDINTPIRYVYMDNDEICPKERQEAIVANVPGNDGSITLVGGHFDTDQFNS